MLPVRPVFLSGHLHIFAPGNSISIEELNYSVRNEDNDIRQVTGSRALTWSLLWAKGPYPLGDLESQGGDFVSTMPVCVCPKVKDMGPFSASSE